MHNFIMFEIKFLLCPLSLVLNLCYPCVLEFFQAPIQLKMILGIRLNFALNGMGPSFSLGPVAQFSEHMPRDDQPAL